MLIWPLLLLLALALILLAVMLIRTAWQMRFPTLPPPLPLPEVDAGVAAGHLAQALRCPTLSRPGEGAADPAAFEALHRLLQRNYPRLHASLECRRVGGYSLLYRWPGSRPDLAPVLLAAHQDVVPAGEEAGASSWSHPPFGGEIAQGYIWGRGALDMKGPLSAIFEAVENLLRADYRPQRTLYLALGEDEECGGLRGAAQIADLLAEEGITPLAVLDEGGAVVEHLIRGVDVPVALIGLAEKGFAVVHLSVSAPPGHAALPGRETAISILSRAIARLEARPFPARLEVIRNLYAALGAAASPGLQFLLANTWLFGGLLARTLSTNPLAQALIRTTAVTTLVRGGIKDNVLPPFAEAWVNCRILPGETIAETLERLRTTIADPRVQVELVPGAA
jgi:carboxypeptidase PM20D1